MFLKLQVYFLKMCIFEVAKFFSLLVFIQSTKFLSVIFLLKIFFRLATILIITERVFFVFSLQPLLGKQIAI